MPIVLSLVNENVFTTNKLPSFMLFINEFTSNIPLIISFYCYGANIPS